MNKAAALEAVKSRAEAVRMPMYQVCGRAKVSPATIWRWEKDPTTMSLSALGRMEYALDQIEAERAER